MAVKNMAASVLTRLKNQAKLINLMYPCDMSKVIEERQWQFSKLDELSQ